MADAAYVESQVSAAIAGVVPSMVATVVRQEAPGAVREEVGTPCTHQSALNVCISINIQSSKQLSTCPNCQLWV